MGDYAGNIIGGFLQPLFWLMALSVCLWIVRKLFPSWETALFKVGAIEGIRMVIRRAAARLRRLHPSPPAPSEQAQMGTARSPVETGPPRS